MGVESAADRAVFVEAAGFGSAVAVTPRGGASGVSCLGIFDAAYLLVSPEGEGQVATVAPVLTVTADDLGRLPRGTAFEGDVARIGSDTYEITEVQPDGTGMVMLRLEKK